MIRISLKKLAPPFLGLMCVFVPLGCEGSTGPQGPVAPVGPIGPVPLVGIDASTVPDSVLAELDLVGEITNVSIASPPVVTFTLKTDAGVPILGLVPFWEDSNRFVRFTITKVIPAKPSQTTASDSGDPATLVAYVRDATTGEPDYDTGASLVDNNDGSYTFTFNTDVTSVPGVPYEPMLTHRVAGQIGSRSVSLEEQNIWMDFIPDGGMVITNRKIATMASCNECHDKLVFHGRRFEVEYCVQCHNPDLSDGEGDFAFMIHRIHRGGDFTVLDGGISYSEVTYPQDVINCRKCHNGDDIATPEANNWRTLPNKAACSGCHDNFGPNAANAHTGGVQASNSVCVLCHSEPQITTVHATPNVTENNPDLPFAAQHSIVYEMIDTVVDGTTNDVTVQFKILSDGTALDVTNLPAEFKNGSGVVFRFPSFLLAYALPQDGIATPADYNNLGQTAGQPISASLGDFSPIETTAPIGTLSFNPGDGVMTATITDAGKQFPVGATLRAVGLQSYMRQDLDSNGAYDVSLHTTSAVAAVTGDVTRREIVDSAKCSQCHEIFEGHGGNRVFSAGSAIICVMCHVPNLTSSGRTVDPANINPATSGVLGNDPLTYPEDTQNMRDMIHGIHASGFRTFDYEHVRNRSNGIYYNWDEVTFPRGAETNDCLTCHLPGTYELPLNANVLPITVRSTGVANGLDLDRTATLAARGTLPNATDWVNSPVSSTCFYCHTSDFSWAHMTQNGGQLSLPDGVLNVVNRSNATGIETCSVCHGPGKIADVEEVHKR